MANRLLDILNGGKSQSTQAATTSSSRSIDSQQDAWDDALNQQPSTFTAKSLEPEEEKPKKKGLFGITIPDGSENPWDYDATNNIIDTSVPATPKKEETKQEPVNPFVEQEKPKSQPIEYSDAFLKQEEQKDAWQPTWSNDQTIMDKQEVNEMERAIATTTGAAKQYGSGMVNLYGTTAAGLNELGQALGGNTNEYAGWATDPISSAAIPHEQDPEYYEREKKYTDTVMAAADNLSDSAAADLEKAKQGLSKFGQFGVDIATNVIQMGFDAGIAALTGGGSALVPMFLRSTGSSEQEARKEGATIAQQILSGNISGGIEVLTEKVADGLAGIYGKGAADEVTEEFIRKLAKTDLGRSALRFFVGAVEEGGEEVMSDLLSPISKAIYNNKSLLENYKDLNIADILYDFAVGFAVSGATTGGANIATKGEINRAANNALAATDAVENALAAEGVDTFTAEQIAPTVEKALNGEELTSKEKNILMEIRNREDIAAGSPGVENFLNEVLTAQGVETATPVGQSTSKAAQLETALDTAEQNQVNANVETAAPAEEVGRDVSKRARLETELDTAEPTGTTATVAPTTATEETGRNTSKAARLETELDKATPSEATAEENALLTATGITPTTETNKGTNPNKAAQIQTELDTAEKIKQIDAITDELWSLGWHDDIYFFDGTNWIDRRTGQTVSQDTVVDRDNRINELEAQYNELVDSMPVPDGTVESGETVEEAAAQESSENAVESQEESDNENIPAESEENLKTDLEGNTAESETTEQTTEQNQESETTSEAETNQESEQETTTESAEETDEAYKELGEKYGTIEQGEKAARDAAMPKQTTDDTKVSESARTVAESGTTPESRLPDVKSAVVNGKFNFNPTTNSQIAQAAQTKVKKLGWQKALNQWTADVRSGKANADLVAEGAVLLNNAANNGECSGAEFVDIMLDYVQLNRALGKGLAAARILKTLTPEGKLYAFQKTVQNLNNEVKEKKAKNRKAEREQEENQEQVDEAVKDAIDKATDIVFTFEYSDEAAKAVAKAVEARARQSGTSEPTALERLAKTIAKFATERIKKEGSSARQMTATEVLAEMAGNEEFAREVYELAQQYTRKNGTEATNPFTNEALNLTDSKIVQRALAESALATNENAETIRNQSALGMSNTQIAEYLANYLSGTIDASESMQNAIYEASLNYVNNILNTDAKTDTERVNRLVNTIMNRIGEQFQNLAKSDTYTRDSALQAIVDTLTMEYGLDGSSAETIANAIASDFDTKLKDAISQELERRFGEKVEADEKAAKETVDLLAEAINLGAFDSEYASQAVNKLFGVNGEYTLDPALVEEYLAQTDDAGRDAVLEKMEQNIADQIPATLQDKFTALRYLNMLGNLKTQARNIIGNVGNMAMYKAKNTVRSAIESIANAVTDGKVERQYSAFYGTDLYSAALQYFNNNKSVQKDTMGERKYSNVAQQYSNEIENKRRIFKSNILENYRLLTDKLMNEIGDQTFTRLTFADALAGYMKAHGITAEQWSLLVTEADADPTSEAANTVDKATQFAIQQAQEATFRDTNAISKAFSQFDSNWSNFMKTLSQGIMPFRKTPANVLVRMEEFSPLGLIFNTPIKAIQAAKGNSNVTVNDVIDSFAKSFTGSGLALLGFMMAAAGKARTKSDDDKQEAYDKLMGLQDYSITVNGTNITMDWFTPESASFFMGVELNKLLNDGTITMTDLLKVFGNLTSPMMEMSMLSGLNDALDNLSNYNDDTDALPQFFLNSALGYLSQGFTNTLVGQAEQMSEDYRQTYYTNPDNPLLPASVQKAISKAMNKTPGYDYQTSDYIDAWGRKQSTGDNMAGRAFNAFLNPSYTSDLGSKSTAVDEELQRLYDYGQDIDRFPNVFPQQTSRSTKVNGTRLSPEEYDKYATTKGQKSLELVEDLIKSSEYKKMTDDEKAAAISDMYSYATQLAAKEVARGRREDYKSSNSRYDKMETAEKKGISAATYYGYYQKYKEFNDNKSLTAQQKAEKFATYVINQKGLSESQKSFIRDSFKFSTTLTADTESYDKWVSAGLSPEDAEGFRKKVNADGKGSTPSNKEWFAAIEQYATDAEMAEKLWEAANSATWSKSGKSYFQANPSSKFKSSWSGKTYSTPSSKGSSSSKSTSTNNDLLDILSGKSTGSSSSGGSSGSSSGTVDNNLLAILSGKG